MTREAYIEPYHVELHCGLSIFSVLPGNFSSAAMLRPALPPGAGPERIPTPRPAREMDLARLRTRS